eukprot:14767697-Ditylum_brightwellii.AAC.1
MTSSSENARQAGLTQGEVKLRPAGVYEFTPDKKVRGHGFDPCLDDRLWRCGVTAYAGETSGPSKPSGHGVHGMPPCRAKYRSGYAEQFVKMHSSGLDSA